MTMLMTENKVDITRKQFSLSPVKYAILEIRGV